MKIKKICLGFYTVILPDNTEVEVIRAENDKGQLSSIVGYRWYSFCPIDQRYDEIWTHTKKSILITINDIYNDARPDSIETNPAPSDSI